LEDFYEEDEEFIDYVEDNTYHYHLECVMCKEPLFLSYPSIKHNKEIVEKIVYFLRKKGIDEKVLKKIEKIKNYPVCRWDLFSYVGKVLKEEAKNNDLGTYFEEKLKDYYDFDNAGNKIKL